MKALEKFYNERDHWLAILLAVLFFAIAIISFIGTLPDWNAIMNSSSPLSFNNPWIANYLLEIFCGILCLGFCLDLWFYKTGRTKPLAFLRYILGGIGFGIPLMFVILVIISSYHENIGNAWVFEPLFGSWLGMIFGCLLNLKKQTN